MKIALTKADEARRKELTRRSSERVRLHRKLHRDRPQARDVDRCLVESLFSVIASRGPSGLDPSVMSFMRSVKSEALARLGGNEEAAYVLRVRLSGVVKDAAKSVPREHSGEARTPSNIPVTS